MIAPRKILNLCCKAGEQATREDVFETNSMTPESTDTFTPVPHGHVIEMVEDAMHDNGMKILNAEYALSDGVDYKNNKANVPNGRMFGLFQIGSDHSDRVNVIGIRNSHDKSLPLSMACGNNVFVCTNLMLSGEIKVSRKHTSRIMDDLDALVAKSIGRMGEALEKDARRVDAYKSYALNDDQAARIIIEGCGRYKASTPTKITKIYNEWQTPSHKEFRERNVWSLQNAFTEVHKGINPDHHIARGEKLHGLLDSVVGVI